MRSSLRLLPLWVLLFACPSLFGQTAPPEPDECVELTSAQDRCFPVGPVWLRVQRTTSTITGDFLAAPNDIVTGSHLNSVVGTVTQPFVAREGETLTAFADRINASHAGFTVQLVPLRRGETKVIARTDTKNANESVSLTGSLLTSDVENTLAGTKTTPRNRFDAKFEDGPPNFVITLPQSLKDAIAEENVANESKKSNKSVTPQIQVSIRSADTSTYYDLLGTTPDTEWILTSDSSPFAIVTIGREGGNLCSGISLAEAELPDPCHWQVLLCRRGSQKDLVLGMEVKAANDGTAKAPVKKGRNGPAKQKSQESASRTNSSVLIVHRDLLDDLDSSYTVNGKMITPYVGPFAFRPYASVWKIEWNKKRLGCRRYPTSPEDSASISLEPYVQPPSATDVANGIEVGSVKVYDTIALKRMLNDTAAQLASISGFNAAPITAALGNLQGVTRDTSYLSAQVTTTPLPTINQTSANNIAANTSTIGSSSTPGASTSTVTLQCPNGSVPTIGTNGAQGCSIVAPGTPATGSTSTETTNSSTQAPITSQQTTGGSQTQQNGMTTTSGGYAVAVPTAPVSTAIASPTNIGLASADVLAEQVELNSQITTLRMLLQGASSDQYLLTNSRAVATRQQTTIGFTVSLDPPRRFKHAVAEVRIVVLPPAGQSGVSIMNMLPSEKTYNVAKVTSHQNSFGGGVVVEPVSISGSTGRSKDRLYLAKDTDTLALQYPTPAPVVVPEPLTAHERIHDAAKEMVDWQRFTVCEDPPSDGNTIVFGWQFRPVLGADYVKGGQRQVFAQLALPANLNDEYVPTVYVLTRWREYDPQRQVVGETYNGSCSGKVDKSGVALLTPLKVRDLRASDIGNGQIKLTARGDFFASGMSVRSGLNTVSPTTFDGNSVELFASVHDVLQAGGLTLIGPNGQRSPFAVVTADGKEKSCGIARATLHAIPFPDGNSAVTLQTDLGSLYRTDDDLDGQPQPLILIGNQVYGLQESPFTFTECIQLDGDPSKTICTYKFVAPTVTLRNAQSFLVRDLTWDNFRASNKIDFAPSFNTLATLSTIPVPDPTIAHTSAKLRKAKSGGPSSPPAADTSTHPNSTTASGSVESKPGEANAEKTTLYALTGFDLRKLNRFCPTSAVQADPTVMCVKILIGETEAPKDAFQIVTDNLATVSVSSSSEVAKSVRIQLTKPWGPHDVIIPGPVVEWDLTLPKDTESKSTVAPTFLRVGDSQIVTFTGTDWSKCTEPIAVTFDGVQKLTTTFKSDSKSLEVLVPTYITSNPGHKEFAASCIEGAKSNSVKLSIDVLKE
jgi:hypothetical protein